MKGEKWVAEWSRQTEGENKQHSGLCAAVITQSGMKIVCSQDELYYTGMKMWPLRGMRSNLLLVIIEEWPKHTVTVLVMHLLLIGVLEGLAVATVSIQTTHTKDRHTRTHAHTRTHTNTDTQSSRHTHSCTHINIWWDEYRTFVLSNCNHSS